MPTQPNTRQIKNTLALQQLGTAALAVQSLINSKANTEFDGPLRLFASFPTANAQLNFSSSSIAAADGGNKVVPPVSNSVVTNLTSPFINFQTQALSSASHFTISFPTNTTGRFRIAAFSLGTDFKINVTFSAEALTEGALVDPGTLFTSGTPLGYVVLEATSSTAFKTAGSATNIIENAKIFRFGSGAGGGGALIRNGSGTRASPTNVSAASTISVSNLSNSLIYVQGNGGPVTMTATTQITTAGINEFNTLVVRGRSDANSVTFVNGNGLALNGPCTLGADDTLTLIFDGTNWCEQSRSGA